MKGYEGCLKLLVKSISDRGKCALNNSVKVKIEKLCCKKRAGDALLN